MPAFSLVYSPRLDHSAASPRTRRSPTHPHTWTHKEPDTRMNYTASACCLSPAKLSAQNHLIGELLRALSTADASKRDARLAAELRIRFPVGCNQGPQRVFW